MSDRPPEEDEDLNEDEEDYDPEEDEETFINSIIDQIHARQAGKRRRSTQDEMLERALFLINYAEKHGPVTVRQLYYQAVVVGLIKKTDAGYAQVQRQVLDLRRDGSLEYRHIVDATRWMRKPRSFASVEEAIRISLETYRKALWLETEEVVEVWCEKDALAGVIYPVTAMYDVPLMIARGYSSETFCNEAIEAYKDSDRPYYVYYLGDFDRSGLDAAGSLREKLTRLAEPYGIEVHFEQIAVTVEQIVTWNLTTREPKRESAADKKWPHSFACELDAMSPAQIRSIVRYALEQHMPKDELERLKVIEEEEKKQYREAFSYRFNTEDPTEE